MPATETVDITEQTDTAGGPRFASQTLAVVSPLSDSNSSSANEVKSFQTLKQVEDFFGTSEDIVTGAGNALREVDAPVLFLGVDNLKDGGGEFSETFAQTTTSFTLDSGRVPVTDVSDVKVDGSTITGTIRFTHDDPSTLSVSAGDAIINLDTGDGEVGDTPSTDIEVTYTSHDWDTAYEKLKLESHAVLVLPVKPFTQQNHGLYQRALTYASNVASVVVATATESGRGPTDTLSDGTSDFSDFATAVQDARLFPVAVHYSDSEASSAVGASLASRDPAGTMKLQEAPSALTITDTYDQSQFGTEETPATDTFHSMGVTAIFRWVDGSHRFSNDRSNAGLSDFFRFISTRRSLDVVEERIENNLLSLRAASSLTIPFNKNGQGIIRDNILGTLTSLADDNLINPPSTSDVVVPPPDSVSDTDKTNRVYPDIEVSVQLQGQVHLMKITLNASV